MLAGSMPRIKQTTAAMTQHDQSFSGTKLALICGESLVTYLRDDKPDIPYPNTWDFAGGERLGNESPVECGLRELFEELGLRVEPARVEALEADGRTPPAYFGVVHVTQEEIESIRFGDEGQYWTLMSLHDYIDHPRAVPLLQRKLSDYLKHSRGSQT